jgi:RNA polymerase sigma-70 factor, ECF subfamily
LPSRNTLQRFEEAALPYSADAYNLARWLTGSHPDAEDIVQEAFLRAYSAFDSLRGDDVRPWLLAIVRNTTYTWLKRNRPATAAIDLDSQLPCGAPNPEALALALADSDRVRKAVAELPVDFRTAIVLREFEDLSYKEIAAATGAPMGTVMSRIARAREWLKRSLTSHEKGDCPQ